MIFALLLNIATVVVAAPKANNELSGHFVNVNTAHSIEPLGTTYTTYKFAYSVGYEVTSGETFKIDQEATMKIDAQYSSVGYGDSPNLTVYLQKKTVPVDNEVHTFNWSGLDGTYRFVLHKPMNDDYVIENVNYPTEDCEFEYK